MPSIKVAFQQLAEKLSRLSTPKAGTRLRVDGSANKHSDCRQPAVPAGGFGVPAAIGWSPTEAIDQCGLTEGAG